MGVVRKKIIFFRIFQFVGHHGTKNNATPIYTTPPKRLSRAVDRSRTPVVLKKPPAADRERKLKQRIADLESQVQVLESRVKELDQPLLARLVPKLSDGKNLGEEDEESLQYWLGVRSSDSVSQFLDSFPTETRGRNSKLSDSDWVTVTVERGGFKGLKRGV